MLDLPGEVNVDVQQGADLTIAQTILQALDHPPGQAMGEVAGAFTEEGLRRLAVLFRQAGMDVGLVGADIGMPPA
ncbi:hypothetical protein D3C86_1908430 [compost metagenome]